MKKLFNTNTKGEVYQLLYSIFENAIDGIITIDAMGIIQAANPAVAKLFGYSTEEIIGHNVMMLMPSPYHEEHDSYLANYHSTGVRKMIGIGREVKGKRKDGSIFDFYLSISEVNFEEKKNFVGIIHDITQEKKKENELELSKNQFKAIFDNAVIAMIIISDRGLIQMANPATIQLFGFELTEVIGQNIKILMPEPFHSEHDGYISNYKKSKVPKIIGLGRNVKGKKKNGEIFDFYLGVSEIKVGDKTFFAGMIHDLTDRIEKENEIKELNLQLEQKVELRTEELSNVVNKLLETNQLFESEIKERKEAQTLLIKQEEELKEALTKEKELGQLKSRFVSMASHEFRTPLSTILSSISLVGRYSEDENIEKRNKHILRIKDSVKNLTGILNDFLSLSKLEEGKVEIKAEHFNWRDFSNELKEDFSIQLKKGQEIILEHGEESVNLYTDKHLLRNILNNLCSNSIKYSKEGTKIYCKQTIKDEYIILKIQDEGLGIPKEEQEHMFSRFFRANNVSNIQGTGLGLTIVKRYVDLLHGEISFKSIENTGTTFTVKLPMNHKSTK